MATKFTYLGGMCFLIERSDGYRILIDPYVKGNSASPLQVSELYGVDLILVSHCAFDHYGDVVELMLRGEATLLCGNDVYRRVLAEEPSISESRMKKTIYGDNRTFGMTTVRTVLANHISACSPEGVWITAPPLGYIIQVEPGVTYYHPGDTALYSDMRMLRELYSPDVMTIGIAGIRENAPCELTPREAALAVSWVGAQVVVPSHYTKGEQLDEFERHMGSIAPNARVVRSIGRTFAFHPSRVEEL